MALRAGIPLSALGHAALIALALWGLPWLKVRPRAAAPAVTVSLISAADFAALGRGVPARDAPPPPSPAPAPAAPPAPAPVPVPAPEATKPETGTEDADLAPAFDPNAPLGIGIPPPLAEAEPPLAVATPPRPPAEAATPFGIGAPPSGPFFGAVPAEPAPPRPPQARPEGFATAAPEEPQPSSATPKAGDAGDAPATSGGGDGGSAAVGVQRDTYESAVRAAISQALYYPPVAQKRNITGTVRIAVTTARDGRLVSVRVTASSGSDLLDRAAIGAASLARLPAMPASMPTPTLTILVPLTYR